MKLMESNMDYDSQKIEKHFKTSLNSIINKNITIENLEELYIKENVPSNKGLYSILLEAIKFSASDIHIESLTEQVRIRYRLNGLLKEVARFDKNFLPAIISKLKILSGLDIVEKRKAQDGRFSFLYK